MSIGKRIGSLAGSVLLAVAACVWIGSAAGATTPAKGGNCVGEPMPAHQAHMAGPANVRCFGSFADAIAAATSDRVRLAETTNPAKLSKAQLQTIFGAPKVHTPDASYVLSIDYKDAEYRGNTFTWYQSSRCGAFIAPHMPSGWNDTISSTHAYSGCAVTLFYNANYGPPTYPIHVDAAASYGGSVLNDQTSSEKWCTHYGCA